MLPNKPKDTWEKPSIQAFDDMHMVNGILNSRPRQVTRDTPIPTGWSDQTIAKQTLTKQTITIDGVDYNLLVSDNDVDVLAGSSDIKVLAS